MNTTSELNGLMRQVGARRVYDERLGISVWQAPAWVCPHCGPGVPAKPDCPHPLTAHGPLPVGTWMPWGREWTQEDQDRADVHDLSLPDAETVEDA